MKKQILFSMVAVLLISAFFSQTTSAGSVETSGSNFESCQVKRNNTNFFVRATEKTIKLRKGTAILWTIPDMQQGLIVVKAKVGGKWVAGEILLDDTTCS